VQHCDCFKAEFLPFYMYSVQDTLAYFNFDSAALKSPLVVNSRTLGKIGRQGSSDTER
jgi:hypothetical protein